MKRNRARGVLLGQFIGDALGTTVEFSSPEDIRGQFPDGLQDVIGGGPFQVHPGQVTDDGELALALARTLVTHGWDLDARARAYAAWYDSGPFDKGSATTAAFGGWSDQVSASAMIARAHTRNGGPSNQANGALMRVSPLAVYGASHDAKELAKRAREDARFSHPSAVCQAANAAFVRAIQVGLHGGSPAEGYDVACKTAADCTEVATALADIETQPHCHGSKQGWVLVALRNAFHMPMHESSFGEALVRTVMAGGDADTNGCITGALLGAFHGLDGIPPRWVVTVLSCRTNRGSAYQTTDAIVLADELLQRGSLPAQETGSHVTTSPAAGRAAEPTRQARERTIGRSRPPADTRRRPGVRTSETDPIRVDWLPGQEASGKLGITIAPGKHSSPKYGGGRWERDLDKDLAVLMKDWKTHTLVCLLEDQDLVPLKIPDLIQRASGLGLEIIRFPIRDGSVPRDVSAVHQLVTSIRDSIRQGKNVVIHCEGGLGRSGVIAGCYLAAEGVSVDGVFVALARARGPNCPETDQQRQFIRAFARHLGHH